LSRVASDHLPIWAEVVASPAIAPVSAVARDETAAPEEEATRQRSQGGGGA
jgi:hypothetical protein